jgi:hypothetical protein
MFTTNDQEIMVRALYAKGYSDTKIAEITGLRRRFLSNWLRAKGLPPNGSQYGFVSFLTKEERDWINQPENAERVIAFIKHARGNQ